MFADDTSLFLSNINPESLVSNVNIEVAKVSRWLKLNKLSLNIKELILSISILDNGVLFQI